jgi:PAS domain S-box-containing protein
MTVAKDARASQLALASRSRLTRRLIVLTVLFSGTIALAISAVQVGLEYRRDVDGIERRFAEVENSYLPSIVGSAWLLDRAQLQVLLDGIARLPDFTHAAVVHRGETLASSGAPGRGVVERAWTLRRPYRGSDVEVGTLSVQASLAGPRARIFDRIAFILSANIGKTLLVAAFMFLLVRTLLMQHLERIAAHVSTAVPGRALKLLELDRAGGRHDDELDRLVAALNGMAQEIQRSHEQLRLAASVFAHASEGIVVTDGRLRILAVNRRYSEISGYAPEELLGQTPRIVRSGRHDAAFYREMWRVIGENGSWNGEVWNRRKSGEIYPEWLSISEVRDAAGGVTNYIGIYYDLSARYAAERSLRESEERYRALISAMHEGVVLRAADGRVLHANPSVVAIFGAEANDAPLGPGAWRPLREDGAPMPRDDMPSAVVLRTGRALPGTVVGIEREGQPITWLSVNAVPLFRNGDATPYAAVTTFRDITVEKQYRDELRRLNESLERQVAERTASLEAANRDLKAFSYSISHDLRAPLRHISGHMGMLRKLPAVSGDADAVRFAKRAAEAAERLDRMVDGLLKYAHLGQQALRLEEVNLGALVAAVRAELESQHAPRRIDWRIGELPAVTGDPLLLHLVLQNLLDNALKYSRDRDPARIEVSATQDAQAVTVCVRDNGVGFDMRYASRLFGAFERMHSEQEFAGTGIGLAHVKRIVERHGGRVWFEAAPGEGAAFYFSLPRGSAPAPA